MRVNGYELLELPPTPVMPEDMILAKPTRGSRSECSWFYRWSPCRSTRLRLRLSRFLARLHTFSQPFPLRYLW